MTGRWTIYVCPGCGKRDEYGIAGRLPDHTRCPCGGDVAPVEVCPVSELDANHGLRRGVAAELRAYANAMEEAGEESGWAIEGWLRKMATRLDVADSPRLSGGTADELESDRSRRGAEGEAQ